VPARRQFRALGVFHPPGVAGYTLSAPPRGGAAPRPAPTDAVGQARAIEALYDSAERRN